MQSKFFSSLLGWLATTEMFARPSKTLPGKWVMFEFYYEPDKELIHKTGEQLKNEKLFWEIELSKEGKYTHKTNLDILVVSKIINGNWSRSKNFITFMHPTNFRDNVEFQFAIEKGNLKLLKKDALGKIEFFGFFQKDED